MSILFLRPRNQYKAGSVRRELNKLYCGFQDAVNPDYAPAIATGNWGCGAFRGNPVFKGGRLHVLRRFNVKL